VAAHWPRRGEMLGRDAGSLKSSIVDGLIVTIRGFGHGTAAAVLDNYRRWQINQLRRQVIAIHLPLICIVNLAQQWSGSALSPVILFFCDQVAEDGTPIAGACVISPGDLANLPAGINGGLDANRLHIAQGAPKAGLDREIG